MNVFDSTIIQGALQPDIIDEVSDDVMFLGYLNNGSLSQALICKLEKNGTVITRKYADGNLITNSAWSDRANLTYLFKR